VVSVLDLPTRWISGAAAVRSVTARTTAAGAQRLRAEACDDVLAVVRDVLRAAGRHPLRVTVHPPVRSENDVPPHNILVRGPSFVENTIVETEDHRGVAGHIHAKHASPKTRLVGTRQRIRNMVRAPRQQRGREEYPTLRRRQSYLRRRCAGRHRVVGSRGSGRPVADW
jgi:hypothetical protein